MNDLRYWDSFEGMFLGLSSLKEIRFKYWQSRYFVSELEDEE